MKVEPFAIQWVIWTAIHNIWSALLIRFNKINSTLTFIRERETITPLESGREHSVCHYNYRQKTTNLARTPKLTSENIDEFMSLLPMDTYGFVAPGHHHHHHRQHYIGDKRPMLHCHTIIRGRKYLAVVIEGVGGVCLLVRVDIPPHYYMHAHPQ